MATPEENDCECYNWCRLGLSFNPKHHPNCKHYSPLNDAASVIKALLKGIEAWAGDEDGVHPDCWEAYKRAKCSVNQFDLKEK